MDEAGRKRLWQDYHRLKSQDLREKIIDRKSTRLNSSH